MIKIRDLSVEFSNGTAVVDNANLDIIEDKKTMIIGESGSGKSVLMLSILRLLPENAKISGSIMLDDIELTRLNENQIQAIRGAEIAYIPQGSGNGLNPLLSVGYQVSEPIIEHHGKCKKEAFIKGVELLKKLKLGNEENRMKSYPHTLSGGMKQRVLIAVGLAADAKVLFADEPTKGLDSGRIDAVVEIFNNLEQKTMLCVTHDLCFAKRTADYVCVMYSAQIIEYAPREEFFKNPMHPYSQAMLNALPENGLFCNMGFSPEKEDYDKICCHFYYRCPYKSDECKTAPPMVKIGERKVRCHLYADKL